MAYFTQKPSCTIKGQYNTQGFVRNPSWPNRIIIPAFAWDDGGESKELQSG